MDFQRVFRSSNAIPSNHHSTSWLAEQDCVSSFQSLHRSHIARRSFVHLKKNLILPHPLCSFVRHTNKSFMCVGKNACPKIGNVFDLPWRYQCRSHHELLDSSGQGGSVIGHRGSRGLLCVEYLVRGKDQGFGSFILVIGKFSRCLRLERVYESFWVPSVALERTFCFFAGWGVKEVEEGRGVPRMWVVRRWEARWFDTAS